MWVDSEVLVVTVAVAGSSYWFLSFAAAAAVMTTDAANCRSKIPLQNMQGDFIMFKLYEKSYKNFTANANPTTAIVKIL